MRSTAGGDTDIYVSSQDSGVWYLLRRTAPHPRYVREWYELLDLAILTGNAVFEVAEGDHTSYG